MYLSVYHLFRNTPQVFMYTSLFLIFHSLLFNKSYQSVLYNNKVDKVKARFCKEGGSVLNTGALQ